MRLIDKMLGSCKVSTREIRKAAQQPCKREWVRRGNTQARPWKKVPQLIPPKSSVERAFYIQLPVNGRRKMNKTFVMVNFRKFPFSQRTQSVDGWSRLPLDGVKATRVKPFEYKFDEH